MTRNFLSGAVFLAAVIAGAAHAGGYVDWKNKTPLQQSQDTAQITSGGSTISGANFVNSVFTDKNLIGSVNNDPLKTPSTSDPVSTVTGNNYHDETDFVIKGRGLNFVFTRTYNSAPASTSGSGLPIGFGWTHSYNMRLRSNDYGECPNCSAQQKPENANNKTSSITYVDERGGEVNYLINDVNNTYAVSVPKGVYDTLLLADAAEGNAPSLTFRNGVKYVFQIGINLQLPGQTARLAKIKDPFGNQLTFTYTGSNLTSISDGLSIGGRTGVVTLSYNGANQLTAISDWTGRTWTYGYAASGDLTSASLTVGGVAQAVTYTYYAGTHNLKDVILPESRGGLASKVTFSYYQNGKTFNYANSLGQTEALDYDLFRRSTRVTDPRGGVREYFYDSYGQMTKLVEPDGAILQFENNADTTLRFKKYDALGFATTYSYRADKAFTGPSDTGGQVTREQDALGQTIDYSYGIYDQATSVKDKKGVIRSFDYYPSGNGNFTGKLQRERISQLTVNGVVYTNVLLAEYTYFANGNLQTKTEYIDPANTARKRTGVYAYDSAGLNLSQLKVSGSGIDVVVNYTYDALGRRATQAVQRRLVAGGAPQSLVTSYDYDERDRVIRVTDPIGNQLETVYDKNGKVTQIVAKYKKPDATFDTRVLSTRTYDAAERLATQTDIQSNTRSFKYDAGGNLVSYKDANNHTTRYEYDAMGRRTAVINANGHRSTTAYDLSGRPTGVTNAIGKSTSTAYDAIGRPTSVTDAKGFVTTMAYDANGNVTKVIDANARDGLQPLNVACAGTVCKFYDELNRVVREVDAADGETKYVYDLLGNVVSITDAEGRTTSYTYDDLGRRTQVAHPGGGTTTFTYDLDGSVLTQVDRKGQALSYRYDQLGRLVEVQYPDGAGQTAADTFSFDLFGNRSAAGQYIVGQGTYPGTALYSYTYDTKGRLTGKTDLRLNRSLAYSYDPVGNIQTKTDYQGQVTTYRYDHSNRMVEMGNADYGATLGQVSYQYDAAGRLLARILANGAKTVYDYDDNNRLTSLVHYGTNDNVVLNQTFNHDQVGNILSKSDASGMTYYKYDALYRLTQANYPGTAPDEMYTYDRVGNRVTATIGGVAKTYVVDTRNRLTEVKNGSTTVIGLVYDANGNTIKKCQGAGVTVSAADCAGSNTTGLLYDGRNRPTAIGANTYKYDPFDYRIQKSGAGGTLQYLLEGEHVEAVYRNAQVEAKYLRGAVIDEVVMGQEKDAANQLTAYNFHHDALQSLNAKTGSDGALLQTVAYGAFGNTLLESDPSSPSTFVRYTGREQDRETDLYYYRARYYDPAIGRFIQEDPLGFKAGANFYAYVNNNPINANDPTGQLAFFWHYAITLFAGLSEGLGLESFSLAAAVAKVDLTDATTGSFSLGGAWDKSAATQNWHGMVGEGQTTAQAREAIVNNINTGLKSDLPLNQVGSFAWATHDLQDAPVPLHLDHAVESGFWNTVVHTLGDVFPSLTTIGNAFDNTVAAIQARKDGASVGLNSDGTAFIVPSPDSGASFAPPTDFGAAGGFVLYPNKSNLNTTRSVYSK